jgi:ABC-type cobalamin transport system ATPase subunit
MNVGLDYLALSRSSKSLSGGEAQRIRLATQLVLSWLVFCIFWMNQVLVYTKETTKTNSFVRTIT